MPINLKNVPFSKNEQIRLMLSTKMLLKGMYGMSLLFLKDSSFKKINPTPIMINSVTYTYIKQNPYNPTRFFSMAPSLGVSTIIQFGLNRSTSFKLPSVIKSTASATNFTTDLSKDHSRKTKPSLAIELTTKLS